MVDTPNLSSAALADRLEAVDHTSLEDCFAQSPLYAYAAATLRALSAEVIRLRAECFALAAGACGGHYGDDHGHSRCSLVDVQRTRADAAEALLREAGEVLNHFGVCADDWVEMGDNRIVNPERLVWGGKPIFVGNLRAARALAAQIDAALGGDA